MRNKQVLCFYVLSIFLLANGAFSNYIFTRLHLSMWRQLIFALGLYIMVRQLRTIGYNFLSSYVKKVRVYFLIIVAFSFLTIVFDHFNLIRITYTWWAYFSGLPFIVFPFVAAKSGCSDRQVNWLFIVLGLFQTIGLITDYFTGGIFTTTFQVISKDSNDLIELGRYCFLSETPTTFGVYYTLCMIMCFKEFLREQVTTSKFIVLIIATSYIIGAWFTGSRQIVVVLALVYSLLIVYVLISSRKSLMSLVLLAFTIYFFSPALTMELYDDDAYEERYSNNSVKEDTRYKYWEEGMQYCVFDLDAKRILIGEGVGYVHAQKAKPNERIGRHFENSIWTRMSESGIIGIWLYVLPIIVLIKNYRKKSFVDFATLVAFAGYLFISYVSPNGEHQTSQMSLYLAFGLFLYERYSHDQQLKI